jgi:uncharacterized damage-inducible protein DinB
MNAEIEAHSAYLRKRVADIHEALRELSPADLNRAPDVPGANTAFVIATHTFGNLRAWVLGIVCGQDLRRDRPAEFASRGAYEDLGVAACKLSGEIDEALQKLDPKTLDDVITPAPELFGEGQTYEMTRREALLHPLEHASIHLGHIQMTVQLLKAGRQ